jgi:hypothetical protein
MNTKLTPRQICVKIAGKLTVDTATVKRVMDGKPVRSVRDRAAILRGLQREGFTPKPLEEEQTEGAEPEAATDAEEG